MSMTEAELRKRIRAGIDAIRINNPHAYQVLQGLHTSSQIVQWLPDFNEASYGSASYGEAQAARSLDSSFIAAADLLSDDELQAFWDGIRPPCDKYPGIWPLCKLG